MITVICGPMFSGKTKNIIIQSVYAYDDKIPFIGIKHASDTRYAKNEIVSHDGELIPAVLASTAKEIEAAIDSLPIHGLRCVGIDEAQFFGLDLVDLLNRLHGETINFTVACLDLDSEGKPWETSMQIMAIADVVYKIRSGCAICGMPASRTQRLTGDKTRHLVGGAEEYSPRCLKHWSQEPTPFLRLGEREL